MAEEELRVRVRVVTEGDDPAELAAGIEKLKKAEDEAARGRSQTKRAQTEEETSARRRIDQLDKEARSAEKAAVSEEHLAEARGEVVQEPGGRFRDTRTGRFTSPARAAEAERRARPAPAEVPVSELERHGGLAPFVSPTEAEPRTVAPAEEAIRRREAARREAEPREVPPAEEMERREVEPREAPSARPTEAPRPSESLRARTEAEMEFGPHVPVSPPEGAMPRIPMPGGRQPLSPEHPSLIETEPFHAELLRESRGERAVPSERAREEAQFLTPDSPTLMEREFGAVRDRAVEQIPDEPRLTGQRRERVVDIVSELVDPQTTTSPEQVVRALERQVVDEARQQGQQRPSIEEVRGEVRDNIREVVDVLGEKRALNLIGTAEEHFRLEEERGLSPGDDPEGGMLRQMGEAIHGRAGRARPTTVRGGIAEAGVRTMGSLLGGGGGGGMRMAMGGAAAGIGLGVAFGASRAILGFANSINEAGQAARESEEHLRRLTIGVREGVAALPTSASERFGAQAPVRQQFIETQIGLMGQGLGAQTSAGFAGQAIDVAGRLGQTPGIRQEEALTAAGGFAQGDMSGLHALGIDFSEAQLQQHAVEMGFTSLASQSDRLVVAFDLLEDKVNDIDFDERLGITRTPATDAAAEEFAENMELAGQGVRFLWDNFKEGTAVIAGVAGDVLELGARGVTPFLYDDPTDFEWTHRRIREEPEGEFGDNIVNIFTPEGEPIVSLFDPSEQELERHREQGNLVGEAEQRHLQQRQRSDQMVALQFVDPQNRIEELQQLIEETDADEFPELIAQYTQMLEQAHQQLLTQAQQFRLGVEQIEVGHERGLEDIALSESRAVEDIWLNHGRQVEDIHRNKNRSIEDLELNAARSREDIYLNQSRQLEDLERNIARSREDIALNLTRSIEDINRSMVRSLDDANLSLSRQLDDLDRQFARSMEDRTLSMEGWVSATERVFSRFGHSSGRLIVNLEDQNRRFEDWLNNLTELRDRGLSEDAIRVLGADDPQNEAQVRALAEATDEEIQRMNELVTRRMDLAEEAAPVTGLTERERDYARASEDIARGHERTLEDIGRNVERSFEDVNISVARSLDDLNRNTVRSMQDLALNTERALSDVARNAERSFADLDRSVDRQLADLNLNVDRRLIDLNRNTERSMEDLNRNAERGMEDLVRNITGGYERSSGEVLTLLNEWGARLNSQALRQGYDAGRAFSGGMIFGLRSTRVANTSPAPRTRETTSSGGGGTPAHHFADGGIAIRPQLGLVAEAGDAEAMVPLNRRGVEFLAKSIRESGMVFQRELTGSHRDAAGAVPANGYDSGEMNRVLSAVAEALQAQAAASGGPRHHYENVEVVAQDPAEFERKLQQRQQYQRLSKPARGGVK